MSPSEFTSSSIINVTSRMFSSDPVLSLSQMLTAPSVSYSLFIGPNIKFVRTLIYVLLSSCLIGNL